MARDVGCACHHGLLIADFAAMPSKCLYVSPSPEEEGGGRFVFSQFNSGAGECGTGFEGARRRMAAPVCRCAYCTSVPQDGGALQPPVVLRYHRAAAGTAQVALLTPDGLEAEGEMYGCIEEAEQAVGGEFYLRVNGLGSVPLGRLRELAWDADGRRATPRAEWTCTAARGGADSHCALDDAFTWGAPGVKHFVDADGARPPKRARLASQFDPARAPAATWTSDALATYFGRSMRSRTVGQEPVMLRIEAERVSAVGPSAYRCVLRHPSGGEVQAWLPGSAFCGNAQYQATLRAYAAEESADALAWDTFEED